MQTQTHGRPRGPGFAYGGAALAMLALVAFAAMTVRQPPPPTIAEFAPQAVEQITEPSQDSSADARGGAGAAVTPTPPPRGIDGVAPIDVPRARRCVGDPPRQTEDPQSPPCVPYWQGDNGGSTAKGVTRDEVRVAFPLVFLEDEAATRLLAKHFNSRFEFYGRTLRLLTYAPGGNLAAHPDPARDSADAVKVDEELKAFASLDSGLRYGAEHYYHDELSRRGILSVRHVPSALETERRMSEKAPYQWASVTATDVMLRSYGNFVCSVLAGHRPAYAAGAEGLAQQRAFGLIVQRSVDGTVADDGPLRANLARCGANPVVRVVDQQSADTTRNGENAILAMRNAGATSVICVCFIGDVRGVLMPAATSQGYSPEWLLSSYGVNDTDNAFDQAPPEQASRVLGLTFMNKWLPRSDAPWYLALRGEDPTYNVADGSGYSLQARYVSMLLLASGMQMAGPNLTAANFERALQRTRFPNPGAQGPPLYQGRVDLSRSHTWTSDASMYWYSRTTQGTVNPSTPGAVCYVDLGRRYNPDNWPKMDPKFQQMPCR